MPRRLRAIMPDGTIQERRAGATSRPRPQVAERTRRDILGVARAEFAEHGLDGASVNRIAARMRTTKPMIYYHFGSKDGLFAAVMAEVYDGIRAAEQGLQLDHLPPAKAMRRLVEATFDYHAANPDWVRLISIENFHGVRCGTAPHTTARRGAAVPGAARTLLERGQREGAFRGDVAASELHLVVSSLCSFRVSNRHTWKAVFGRDPLAPEVAAARRRLAVDTVLALLAV